jgi:hypothetical protein
LAGGFPAFFSLAGDGAGDAEVASFSVSLVGKFELVLAEWHLTPEYLLDNWTDEQFEAFWQSRNQRILAANRAVSDAVRPDGNSSQPPVGNRIVSDQELFEQMGMKPQGSA